MKTMKFSRTKGPGASRIPFIPLMAVTVALAVISVGESKGWPVSLYSSPVMMILWVMAVIAAVWALAVRKTWKRPATFFIHVAFVIILAGAAITHFCSTETEIHLRAEGAPALENGKLTTNSAQQAKIPDISLKEFRIETYPGTSTPMDFISVLTDKEGREVELRMNKTLTVGKYKLVQSQFDSDGMGVILKCSSNRTGTTITYIGYIMLGLSFLMYFSEGGSIFRRSLRYLLTSASVMCALLSANNASAADIPQKQQIDFMRLLVLHNGRITSLSTLATDFTATVTGGKSRFDGMDASELFRRFLFDFGTMKGESLIRVKNGELKKSLQIEGRYASYEDYMRAITSGRLDIEDYEVARLYADDIARFEAINMLVSGELLKMFPVRKEGATEWYSPADVPSRGLDADRWIFIRKSLGYLNESILTGDAEMTAKIIDGISNYQTKESGIIIPVWKIRLEQLYNRLASAIALLVILIASRLLGWILTMSGLETEKKYRVLLFTVCAFGFLWLTLLIVARWIVGGHVPLSNGFETMQFMAWSLLLIGMLTSIKMSTLLSPAMFASGLSLGVAAMSGAAKSVGNLVPVLSSPLLSVHVVLVMFSYSLFLLLALNGGAALMAKEKARTERLLVIGRVMLYPAVFLLGAGIFVGAVWADVSWGSFWSWDPKETWALITMLIYSFSLHPASLPMFRNPRAFHIYMIVAFSGVLITYFGVNFYLGGMHSYA